MNVYFFDNPSLKASFLPLTFTRSVADLRLGIFNFHERWHWLTNSSSTFLKEDTVIEPTDLLISAHAVITKEFVALATTLVAGDSLWMDDVLLARKGSLKLSPSENKIQFKVTYLTSLWDLTEKGKEVLDSDITLVKLNKATFDIEDEHTVVYNKDQVFVAEGAVTRAAVLNAENGPIFLAKNAQVLEGTVIYGPAYIGENTIVGVNSKLLGGTYIGSNCVVGGEIKRSYIQANSNKAHDGYLGDSVLGEWCNLGASTNVSNLKNNFGDIKMWSYASSEVVESGRWKAGVLMGDYCKTSIGSRINSGTTMGVGVTVFSPELSDKFYNHFSWGTEKYDFDKFLLAAEKMWEISGFKPTEDLIIDLRDLAR